MRPPKPSLPLVAAIAFALAAAGAAAKKQYATPVSAEDFEKLLQPLAEQAEAYAKQGGDPAPTPGKEMASIQYSVQSGAQLAKALQARHKDPLAEMHIAWQLLQPLSMAGDELLVRLRPAMVELLGRCEYQPMPDWPASILQTLAPDRKDTPKNLVELRRQRREAALAQKRNAERAIVKHNRMAQALEQTLKSLLVLMGDEKADQALLARFRSEVQMKWTTYAHTLQAIRGQAVRMKKEQAKVYYDALLDVVREHPKPREHADPTRPAYSDTGNSTFETRPHDVPAETLKVVNLLATSAREPAVIVAPDKRPPRKPGDPRDRRR
ncbi:MAG TPA: hypothetical protein VFJ30_01945 [Phycisphaerae bacterium]|nr:hypothetical protein [Phycisphaerae bacterium]